ncbi:MAG: hypothetical protein HY350_02430, partial [Candidatus Omnitrophica bacterium]|nr:hypothetical protein [Candidatus Omnitrophota bacterium]
MRVKLFSISLVILQVILSNFCSADEKLPTIKEDGYTSSLVCGRCHDEIYSKWGNSMHAMSYTDPIFEVAYMRAQNDMGEGAKPVCLSCHAPSTRQNNDVNLKDPVTREGVTCDFCHTIKGINPESWKDFYQLSVGITKFGPLKELKPLLHKVESSDLFTRSEFCAGCHELKADNGLTVMGTYTEWKETSYAKDGVQCQNCHM